MKLLSCSDLCCDTGFATVARNVLSNLACTYGYDIHSIAINATGDPHPDQQFASVYPAFVGGDYLGINRIDELVSRIDPDVIWLFNDIQVIERWFDIPILEKYPVVVYFPIDSAGISPKFLRPLLRKNVTVVTYTEFAKREIESALPELYVDVIGHGVDTSIFYPLEREERLALRHKYGIADDWVIFLNVNRNQLRKNIPATLRAFASVQDKLPEAKLYLHMVWNEGPPLGAGWDIYDLVRKFGLKGRVMATTIGEDTDGKRILWNNAKYGIPVNMLADIYRVCDVFVNTTMGEGYSLTTLEAMACGLPVIATDCSAISEIVKGRGLLASVKSYITMHYGTEFAIVDEYDVAKKMVKLVRDVQLRKDLGQMALEWASQQTWGPIVDKWNEIFLRAKSAANALSEKAA